MTRAAIPDRFGHPNPARPAIEMQSLDPNGQTAAAPNNSGPASETTTLATTLATGIGVQGDSGGDIVHPKAGVGGYTLPEQGGHIYGDPPMMRRVPDHRGQRVCAAWFDFVLIGVTVVVFVMAVMTMVLNGETKSQTGNFVMGFNKVAATLWPILFAAVMGNCVRASARRRLEMGERLGTLEQLMGSQTFIGTYRTAFTLRQWCLCTTISLMIIWILSPIAGQAALHALYSQTTTLGKDLNVTSHATYLDLDPLVIQGTMTDSASSVNAFAWSGTQMKSLFVAAMMAPEAGFQYPGRGVDLTGTLATLGGVVGARRVTGVDMWKNVRVPIIGKYPGGKYGDGGNGVGVPPLSSLIGVPVNLPGWSLWGYSFAEFGMETNYHEFECGEWVSMSDEDFQLWVGREHVHWTFPKLNMTEGFEWPYTEGAFGYMIQSTTPVGGFSDRGIHREEEYAKNMDARDIVFASRGRTTDDANFPAGVKNNVITCGISMRYVKVTVECHRNLKMGVDQCGATEVVDSTLRHRSTNWTELDNGVGYGTWRYLADSFGSPHPGASTMVERFLFDPNQAFTNGTFEGMAVDLSGVEKGTFGRRLGLVYNTWSRAGKEPYFLKKGLGKATTEDLRDAEHGQVEGYEMVTDMRVWSPWEGEVYVYRPGWAAVWVMASLVLVVVQAFSTWARVVAVTPRILGWVSSGLTRDREVCGDEVSERGTWMDGGERARLVRDVVVKVGDVSVGLGVGRQGKIGVRGGIKYREARGVRGGAGYI